MSRQPLRAPLARLFDQRLPEQTVRRLWLRIGQFDGARHRRRGTLLAAAFAAAAGVLLMAGVYFWPRPASLRLANRSNIPTLLASRQPNTVAFDDGSQVELGRETRIDVLQSTPHVFVVALRTGRARFSVIPDGPRTWRIECGPISVDVLGTIFSVERGSSSVRVQVERGRVLVSGEGVPDRVARVSASESLVVPIGVRSDIAPGVSETTSTAPLGSAAPPLAPPLASDATAVPGTPVLAGKQADHEPAAGIRVPPSSEPSSPLPVSPEAVAVLLQQADSARRKGDFAQAASLLQRILTEYPNDAQAPLTQFTLGRLYLESLAEPRRAVGYFTRAIEGGVPAALAEDAHARLVQALARAGDRDGAAGAAARYRARYPQGRHLQYVNRWAAPPSEH